MGFGGAAMDGWRLGDVGGVRWGLGGVDGG